MEDIHEMYFRIRKLIFSIKYLVIPNTTNTVYVCENYMHLKCILFSCIELVDYNIRVDDYLTDISLIFFTDINTFIKVRICLSTFSEIAYWETTGMRACYLWEKIYI